MLPEGTSPPQVNSPDGVPTQTRITSYNVCYTKLLRIPGGFGLLAVNLIALGAGVAVVPTITAVASIAPQIAYFAAGTVVFGVLAFNSSVKHLGPLNVMLMLNVIPVSVFAIEAALGRDFAPIELGGAAMVIGALVANNLYLRRRG